MYESTIRERLRAAVGESTYPPSLSSSIAVRLKQPRAEARDARLRWLTIVAVLLAVTVVAALLGAHALRARSSIPVKPPQVQGPASSSCPGWRDLSNGYWPLPEKMTSPITGWAMGALRTTDGGRHWRDMSPNSIRNDAPAGAARSLQPPIYAEFFLDANHAWLARGYSSPATCSDHIDSFATSDGGRTWRQSAPISLNLGQRSGATIQLSFVDAHTGWLWVGVGPMVPDIKFGGYAVYPITGGDLHATSDGGLHWNLISNVDLSKIKGISSSSTCPPEVGTFIFASASLGWMTFACLDQPELLTTRDGGRTWLVQHLSGPVGTVQFFDSTHGVVESNDANGTLLATSDGGSTWHALPPLPETGSLLLDLAAPNDFWDVATPPGWNKFSPVDLYHSGDGGETWTLAKSNVPIGWPPVFLMFVDPKHGFASQGVTAIGGTSSRGLLVTSDGGLTWTVVQPQVS